MPENEKFNYVEFAASDIESTKRFFARAFGWEFTDYGPDYASFSNQGLDGGFFRADKASTTDNGGALVILYSEELEKTKEKVLEAGAHLTKDIFSFPGGRRFHFAEPSGNELAVWGP